jgi:hypothetical protein
MKKLQITILIAAALILAVSCKEADTLSPQKSEPDTKPAITQPDKEPVQAKELEVGPLKDVSKGKITGLQIGIGSPLQAVIAELGEPAELEHFEGTSYLSYPHMNIMLDRVADSTKEEALVAGISVFDDYSLCGVKIGMTAQEIQRILGAPDQEYLDSEEEGIWRLEYIRGAFQLTFYAEGQKAATTAAYLSRVPQEE